MKLKSQIQFQVCPVDNRLIKKYLVNSMAFPHKNDTHWIIQELLLTV